MFEGLPEERTQEVERVWQDGQRALAGLSTNSTHHVVDDAGHNIQFDRPDLVVESIRTMVTAPRGR